MSVSKSTATRERTRWPTKRKDVNRSRDSEGPSLNCLCLSIHETSFQTTASQSRALEATRLARLMLQAQKRAHSAMPSFASCNRPLYRAATRSGMAKRARMKKREGKKGETRKRERERVEGERRKRWRRRRKRRRRLHEQGFSYQACLSTE